MYQRIMAHHLVFSGYGTWLSNDLRGSGSSEIRKPEFEELGPIHFGRKIVQPSRPELRAFHREASPILDHKPAWFDEAERICIADAFGKVVRDRKYTCYAYCSCRTHAHGMVRAHRDRGQDMWMHFAHAMADALKQAGLFPSDHPIWAARVYDVYKTDVPAVAAGVTYIEVNPTKEGLPRQYYDFVTKYDGWPLYHKRKR